MEMGKGMSASLIYALHQYDSRFTAIGVHTSSLTKNLKNLSEADGVLAGSIMKNKYIIHE